MFRAKLDPGKKNYQMKLKRCTMKNILPIRNLAEHAACTISILSEIKKADGSKNKNYIIQTYPLECTILFLTSLIE